MAGDEQGNGVIARSLVCPVCLRETPLSLLEKWNGYTLYHCQECDVHFFDPMKNPGGKWYEQSELYFLGKALPQSTAWYHEMFLQDGHAYGRNLLDVGCGTGLFLGEARKLGYRVTGVDFDQDCVRIAQERFGLASVYRLSLEEFISSNPDKKFDVITFFEVLEHQDGPRKFIELIRSALTPTGYLAFSVPNRNRRADPLAGGDYPPNHFTRWSERAVKSVLQAGGFHIVKLAVKELSANDLAGALKVRIRLRMAQRMFQQGQERDDKSQVQRATWLMKAKDLVFKALTEPLQPLLKRLKLQGTGLYCLAKRP